MKIKGIVIREKEFSGKGRILTILTGELGKIQAVSYTRHTKKGGYMNGTALFSYSEFIIEEKRMNTLKASDCIHMFSELNKDLERLSLAVYFADAAADCSGENVEALDILRLLLNTYHLLSDDGEDMLKIKAVYELRLMCAAGFMPDLSAFAANTHTLDAMQYIIHSELNKAFSFRASDNVLKELGEISERYVEVHMEKRYRSLDYFKSLQYN